MSIFSQTTAQAVLPLVVAKDVALAYGRRAILSGVGFRIMPGESWYVIGPNGAGKSTLLKAILGLLAPAAGGLALARTLDDRRRLGFVPQRLDLAAGVPTTVREFVGLGFTGLGHDRATRRRLLDAALARVGLTGRSGAALMELSGGQRQRAAIARALVREPLLLVVDEPTTGLDLVAERDLLALLADLNREQGLTIVFVAHDLGMVARHATHIALVAGGAVAVGTAAEILTGERLSQAFGIPIGVHLDGGERAIRIG